MNLVENTHLKTILVKKLLFIALAFTPFLSFTLFAQNGSTTKFFSSSPGVSKPSFEVQALACPTPVFTINTPTLNCNPAACTGIQVLDSASQTPDGFMSPGWKFTIGPIDAGIFSNQARLEVWQNGGIVAAIGNNTAGVGTACTGCYLAPWQTWFQNNVGTSSVLLAEYQNPTITTELRMYYPSSNASFPWSLKDKMSNAAVASGTFNFATVSTGSLTTGGPYSKTDGLNQGTAVFSCPTCPAGSFTDGQGGTATFCTPAAPGKYACTYSFTFGTCSKSYTDTLRVTTTNNASWTVPASVCPNASYNLPSYITGTAGGTWSGTSVSGNTFTPTAPGVVAITYSVGTGLCMVSQTNTITVKAAPTVSTTATPASCGQTNGIASATVSGGTAPYTYAWSPSGGANSAASNLAAGNYVVTVTDNGTCTKTATVTITNSSGPSISVNQTNPPCAGATGTLTASATGGTNPYTYSWSNGNSTSAINALTGTFTITVSDASGCSGTQTATITQPPVVTASVSATSTTISAGGSATLTATGGATYSWTPTTGLSNSTIANPVANPALKTTYCVTVKNAAGCSDTACVTVYVSDNCKEFSIPNAFSPNGDNKNELFRPLPKGCFKDMSFSIYNRWGNLMFTTTDVTQGWNGSSQDGKECTDGVYFYKLKATFINGTAIDQNGTVTLLK